MLAVVVAVMVVMYSFCRYFSVRLGTILVAFTSMAQSLAMGAFLLLCLRDVAQTSEDIKEWSSSNKLMYITDLVLGVQESTSLSIKSGIVFLMLHIGTCLLLIFAAFKRNEPLTWPFLVVEFLRLTVLFLTFVTALLLVKENKVDLGLLLALSLTGVFLLLGLYYMWFCVVSLCQCLRQLRRHPKDEGERRSPQPSSHSNGKNMAIFVSDYSKMYPQQAGAVGWRDYMYSNLSGKEFYHNNNYPTTLTPLSINRLTN